MRAIKKSDLDSFQHLQIPRAVWSLFVEKKITQSTFKVYIELFDRLKLSSYNNWIDKEGDVYLKYSYPELMKMLGVKSKGTISTALTELKELGLIIQKKGYSTSSKFYLSNILDLGEILQKSKKLDDCAEVQKKELHSSKKLDSQKSKKLDPNHNNYNHNNKTIKTTTTNLDNLNNIEQPVKQPEKISSSSSLEIKTIKKYLHENVKDIPTCKNIMELVNSKNLKLEKLQEVIEYANKNQKGLGYIVNALKNDWDVTPVQAKKTNSVPKCGESKKIADTNSYMEKEQIEKEKIKSETVEIIEITEELEKEAVALLLKNGVPREYLETTKRKLKDYYYKILRKALKDYKRVS